MVGAREGESDRRACKGFGVYDPLPHGDFYQAEIRGHADVLWALSTCCDPAIAINVITEAWSTPLGPRITPEARAQRNFMNSVAAINACRPYHWKDQFAKTCYFPEAVRKKTYEKWKDVLRLE
jgi:hypothetical protein